MKIVGKFIVKLISEISFYQIVTRKSVAAVFVLFLAAPVSAQDPSTTMKAKFISENIKLDGTMDEIMWENAESIGNFWQFFPSDSIRAKTTTVVKMLYNDHFLYIGIEAKVSGKNYVVASLRRDFSGTGNDNVTVMFDTYKDGNNAFLFGVTPYGVQREALVSEGGAVFNTSWDIKWQTVSKMYDDHYVIEIAIPFGSIKFQEGVSEWRMQCYRWDLQGNEQSAWSRVPQNQLLSNLAFMGTLQFEKKLGKSHTPFAVIPYVNTLGERNYVSDKSDFNFLIGGDAKVGLGNSLNLDLTVNPDFSNVEVDYVQTNLTRFELFLPEKRQFFMDNSDLFGNFGNAFNEAKPFFSRRIGLARDTLGNLIENRILGGARLSGKIGKDWRLGFLDLQTREDIDNKIASNNNLMLAVQKKVFSRSSLGVFFINRQSVKDYDFLAEKDKFNRVVGADFNLASADNKWTGKFYMHKSFQPDDQSGNLSSQATVSFNSRRIGFTHDWVYIDSDFKSDLGFVPRTGLLKSGNGLIFKFYPKKGIINSYNIQPLAVVYWAPELDYKLTDHDLRLSWNTAFKNQSTLAVRLSNQYIFLRYDFDPTRTVGGVPLPGNKGYTFTQAIVTYQSNFAKKLTYNATFTTGEFYTGHINSFQGELSLRFQPWAIVTTTVNYNSIRLPDPYSDADIWLLSPKLDVTFSKSLFWSTLVQYSNQRENLGINSRLQWRFAPLSDLYLVYNDNYATDSFGPRFRSINLKLTYWLNI